MDGNDTGPRRENNWYEDRRLVLAELARFNESITILAAKIEQLRLDVAILQVKAGVWGLMGGLIPTVIVVLFYLLRGK